jgi:predicted metal-dependent hydrolase
MTFDFERTGFSPHWHGGSPFISHFWSALSQALPPGEKFFIDSVRAVRDRIDDPGLDAEVDQFIRQEAHHTAQHRKFNRMLRALGYDTDTLEARYARTLDRCRKTLGPVGMLSVTMALEHFTAGLAHQYFTNPRTGQGSDPNVEALWAWHAAEEAEHKSTAFDVYHYVGGGYLMRVALLPGSWCAILGITLWNVVDMLRAEGRIDLHDARLGLRYLFGRKGVITGMLPALVSYLSPTFHPWDEDDSAEVVDWERRNVRYVAAEPPLTVRSRSSAPDSRAEMTPSIA